jgi:hypothetical protein
VLTTVIIVVASALERSDPESKTINAVVSSTPQQNRTGVFMALFSVIPSLLQIHSATSSTLDDQTPPASKVNRNRTTGSNARGIAPAKMARVDHQLGSPLLPENRTTWFPAKNKCPGDCQTTFGWFSVDSATQL